MTEFQWTTLPSVLSEWTILGRFESKHEEESCEKMWRNLHIWRLKFLGGAAERELKRHNEPRNLETINDAHSLKEIKWTLNQRFSIQCCGVKTLDEEGLNIML